MRISWKYSALVLLLLAPFVYAFFYTFPAEDDYCRANSALYLFDVWTGLTSIVSAWLRSSGRYVHHFLVVFLGDAVSWRAGYAGVCLGVLGVYAAALGGIWRRVGGAATRETSWFLALAGVATLLASCETLPMNYYFVTDALGVGLGDGMVLVHIWALCRLWHAEEPTRFERLLPVVTAIVSIGCYEHAAIGALVSSATAYWLARETRHPSRLAFLQVLLASIFFCLVAFLAPGNFARLQHTGGTTASVTSKLMLAPRQWLFAAPRVFMSPYPLYALLLALVLPPLASRPGLRPLSLFKRIVMAVTVYAGLLTVAVVLHALGNLAIPAGSKLLESLVLLCAYALVFGLLLCLPLHRVRPAGCSPALAVVPFCLCLALTSNVKRTVANGFNGALDHAAAVLARRDMVLRGAHGSQVRVAPLLSLPFPSFYQQSFATEKTAWSALQVSRYYGLLSAVIALPDGEAAYAAAYRLRAPVWTTPDESGVAFSLATRVPLGPNATDVLDWLFVKVPEGGALPAQLHVAWTQTPPLGALPVFARAIRDSLLAGPSWRRSWLTDCAAVPHTSVLAAARSFTIEAQSGRERIVALPVRGQDGTDLGDVGVSFDGQVYHRIR